MIALLKTQGFIAFISMIFLNAFVDLGHKIIIQNTVFKVYDGTTQIVLTAIVNGLILLPYILLFTPSGYLSDRFKKPTIMRWSAIAAVGLTLLITLFYYLAWFELAFAMTFMLAVQSAFYSPAKYGYIREIAGKQQLPLANGFVQSTTIVAILLGMFVFSILFETALAGHQFETEQDIIKIIAPIGWLLVLGSLVELYFATRLPDYVEPNPETRFDWQRYRSGQALKSNLSLIRVDNLIWLSIIGLSLFWGTSQAVLATFPAYAKEVLVMDNTIIVQGLLACAGIGIVIGSFIAGKICDNRIETGLIALGTVGMALSLLLLPQLTNTTTLAAAILSFGIFGGLFIIPLNALIQLRAEPQQMGTILAGNNWIQNVVMLTFLVITLLSAFANLHSQIILYTLAIITLIGAFYTVSSLAKPLIRFLLSSLFASRYRIHSQNLNNVPKTGAVLLLGNHISWLDWAILQMACPRDVRFVMDKGIYQKWYFKWFLDLFNVIPIPSNGSKTALNAVNDALKQGQVVCLFPEGTISRNGQLAEFKKGFERCVDQVEGVIVPFYLHGLWGSRFSRCGKKLQQLTRDGLRRDITVAFAEPMPIGSQAEQIKQILIELSIQTWQHQVDQLPDLGYAWIKRAKQAGNKPCLTDIQTNRTLSRRKALTASLLFARRFQQHTEQNLGFLLPTSTAGILSNIAALISGKTLVNLNFTSSIESIKAAIEKAELKHIYTSSRFVDKLQEKGIAIEQVFESVETIYLEDLHQAIPAKEKLITLLSTFLPACVIRRLYSQTIDTNQTAAILFSSGSEGSPKGIKLSHKNIIGNIKQVSHVLDMTKDDVMVSSLPLFHAFGLTVTGLKPLIEGIPAICHPDPTDVVNIAKGIARHKATIMCATSTFLRLFNKNSRIHPVMLESLRLTVAGAEKLNPEVRQQFAIKFSKPIYEGYGATETAPVATVNLPDRVSPQDAQIQIGNKLGTIGLPLPGSSIRIIDPETNETLPTGQDGLIVIAGVQVMQGYLHDDDKTQQAIVEIDGLRWYKTGDKGHIDEDGFLTIVDRYSRFAKIGGEMVSLSAVEAEINTQLTTDEVDILTTNIPDSKKGEIIVLLFAGDITERALKAKIKQAQLSPLSIPAKYIAVETIPKLGSGKSDFSKAKQIALAN